MRPTRAATTNGTRSAWSRMYWRAMRAKPRPWAEASPSPTSGSVSWMQASDQ